MADSNMADTLRQFAQNIGTASVRERCKILADLRPCVERKDFPDAAVKGILKTLLCTLGRYHDSKSRHAVEDVIHALAVNRFEAVNKNFLALLAEVGERQKKVVPGRPSSVAALITLSWSCIVIRDGYKNKESGNTFTKMVELQALLVYGACATERASISNGAYNRLKRIWREVPGSLDSYVAAIQSMEQSIYQMCLVGCLMRYLAANKDQTAIQKYKGVFLEQYIKQVIGTRTKPANHLLVACRDLLRHVDHEEFKGTLLPALDRAMLRNPEIILAAFTDLLAGLTIDLSQYAIEIGKLLATHCHSKEEDARQISADGCKVMARQLSDTDAVERIVKHFFGVLSGSEGKLTVVTQRIGMLSGIGNLSYNTVSGGHSVQSLASSVTELFIPTLQQEVHEGTLVHALSMFSLWCAKFSTEIPTKVIEWFKSGMALKTSTSAVRNAYLQCMNTAFHGDTLIQGLSVLPLLVQTVEKAAGQSAQVTLVSEAVVAACVLVRLSLSDIQAESKLASFWTILLDPDKQLFVNDKFLTSASDDTLQSVATLVERLILDHPQRLTGKIVSPYYRALVFTLMRQYKVRKHAQGCVRHVLSSLGGAKSATTFLKEYRVILNAQKLVLEDVAPLENGELPEPSKYITPRVLSEALMTLVSIPSAEAREAEVIAMETLIEAHHPCVVYHNGDQWTDILASLKIDAADFVAAHVEGIVADIKNSAAISQGQRNAISTLARVAPKVILPALEKHICSCLCDPALKTVTVQEFAIMCSPEGELYDKSVIQGGQKEEPTANIKRENKLYSYAEQMAELELRKELAKKKGKSANEEPKLTKKQQEAMDVQLRKEAEIRTRTRQLDRTIENCCHLVSASLCGYPPTSRRHLPAVIRVMMPLMSSPLAAPRLYQLFVELHSVAFYGCPVDEDFGLLVAQCTMRLLEPQCQLDRGWSGEPLKKQAVRAINLLHQQTVPAKGAKKPLPFPASTFAYCFYLLRCALNAGGVKIGGDEVVMLKALIAVSTHAQLRESEEDTESGPQLLPREEILRLCTQIIGTSSGRIQQMAAKCLLDTAEAGGAGDGCSDAEQGEIDALLDALQSSASPVREAALMGLEKLEMVLPTPDVDLENGLRLVQRIFVARFDVEEENKKLAERLWHQAALEIDAEICALLVDDLVHSEQVIRDATANALASFLQKHRDNTQLVLQQILEIYDDKLYMPPPVLDNFGRLVSEGPPDQWAARSGLALALQKLSPFLPEEEIETVFEFFVQKALGDRNEDVRKHMLDAAVAVVNDHGKENVTKLLPVFEEFLAQAPDSASSDAVRQSIVICMGSLAKHLDKDDPKVKPIVGKLIEALSTPSQQVQEAVANCLPPLVPAIKQDAPDLVKKLLLLLLESERYGERKGAAYGLAGLVKGLGILALKQLEIMTTLTEAIQNKKNPRYREGALFAFEMLCSMLGRLFEPYVVHLLPHLLLCFGDANQYVREAADDTAKAVMSKLSAHGVKMVLPSLLKALEEDSWRTKTGSVELLGAMAYCAPKQLSACLPSIVPKLTEVLTDSHLKVQKAGAQALKQIGAVIRNPEIQAIVPVLLEALQDPTKKTTNCLQRLLETKFVHFIDAPSLALIMPVVQRSFQDRSTETRKMAAQIIGNMYSLTDQKDLSPYLPAVIPGLKQSLLDPVPEVRSVSARALGAMVRGMGEGGFEELVPWLMLTLTSENSSVDRSGAAQGLSEVVGGLGLEKLQKLMPDIISTAERMDIAPHVRDGYIMMYIFLPAVFGDDFLPYVGPIIPSVLQALADESEFVRDTALRAGQRVVNLYADTAIELLLPELEHGLFDDNWRIRYSSVQLLGDLLYKISGVSGKMSTQSAGDDDNFGTESSQVAILDSLGKERRNRVLAGLYMGRSDTALMVRQSALHVWKVIVSHTPKMLREILSTLFQLLLGCLASTSYDKRQVAARTLGDIVRKLGEKVLPEIIPILERGLESDQSDQRQGVCIGLSEIMSSTSKEHVVVFADSLIPTVRKALCDPLPEVREAAAQTFDNLHANIGSRALDDILPDLLNQLDDEDISEFALDGLQQVMAVKSRVVLPYLVPQLTSPPVNTRALSFLSSVAGEALSKHLHKILPALMSSLSEKTGSAEEQQELEYCQSVVLSVHDDIGVRCVMNELLEQSSNHNPGLRCAAVTILHAYCSKTRTDITEFVPQLFRGLIRLFTDTDDRVLHASWDCLSAITKKLDASEMLGHIGNIRQAVRFAVSDYKGVELPGFCLPKKGISPILPIFREGILNGPPEMKESAAIGLGEVIKRTSAEALKPSVVNITGPLIRILGDRFSFNVKVAVLETLGMLLGKCGAMLKPFLPQLQTTFIKALNDPNRSVRLKAASALGKLIIIHARVDPLFTELHTGIKNADDTAIRDTFLQALRGCLCGAGSKMSDKIRRELTTTLQGYLSASEDGTRVCAAACLGALCKCLPEDELSLVLNMHLLDADPGQDWVVRHGRGVGLAIALKEAADTLTGSEWNSRVLKALVTYSNADRIPICQSGVRGVGYLARYQQATTGSISAELVAVLVKALKQEFNDIKQLAGLVISFLAKSSEQPLDGATIKALVPMLVNGTREKNTLVKSNSEFALVSLLKLRTDDATYTACLKSLEPGMRDSLTEVHNKVLKKILQKPDITGDDDIDDTVMI